MSPRVDRTTIALVVLALLTVVAWARWDGTMTLGEAPGTVVVAACPSEDGPEDAVRSVRFRLGGTVVHAERWCGVGEVRAEVVPVANGGDVTLTATTSAANATLRPPGEPSARLRVGADGWIAVAIAQADAATLAGGGAWVTLTAGGAPR